EPLRAFCYAVRLDHSTTKIGLGDRLILAINRDACAWVAAVFMLFGIPIKQSGLEMTDSLQLRDYPGDIVRMPCEKCGRASQYRKQNLIQRCGAIFGYRICGSKSHSASAKDKCTTPAWRVALI